MYKFILTFAVLALSTNMAAFADQGEQVITLKDGSQIKGELSGIVNGIYTVKTPIIGDVQINANDVVSITKGDAPPAAALPTTASASPLDQQIAASQQRLMTNPQSMAILKEMMADPDIMQALQDPALVQAVTNHDYQGVASNPGVQKLMSNPRMQALLKELAAQQQQNTTSQ
jgi:hypothetical protein